jgi:hypothetical protein
MYEVFKEYCQANKLPAAYRDQFFRKLTKYATVTTTRPTMAGKRPWCVKGIALKDRKDWGKGDEEPDDDPDLYGIVLQEATRLTKEKGQATRDELESALKGKLTPEQVDRYMKQIVKDGLANVLDWGKWRTLR